MDMNNLVNYLKKQQRKLGQDIKRTKNIKNATKDIKDKSKNRKKLKCWIGQRKDESYYRICAKLPIRRRTSRF